MNMQAAITDTITAPNTVKDRMYGMTYLNMVGLAEALNGGTVGIAPLTRWKQGSDGNPTKRRIVHCFADWLLARYGEARVEALLPQYEGRQRQAHNWPASVRPNSEAPKVVRTTAPKVTPIADTNPVPKAPKPTASKYAEGSMEAIVEGIALKVMDDAGFKPGQMDMTAIRAEIAKAIEEAQMKRVNLTVTKTSEAGETHTVHLGRVHYMFERLLSRCGMVGKDGNRFNVWLTGPAGSGKTTAAMQVAKALGLEFYHTGALDTEYKLLGFTDAQGRVVSTAFRQAWEHGGVFLFDEVDASLPGALMALNAALANGHCAFPDGNIQRHKDCVIIAAANTWGSGATFEYVGRNKIDDASLDRFIKLTWAYDEAMERDTSGNVAWATKVQAWRRDCNAKGIKRIISPRATYTGATMLANGIPEGEIVEELIAAGMTPDQRSLMGFARLAA